MPITPQQLVGQQTGHISREDPQIPLHPEAARAFRQMQAAALAAGHQLAIASGFRSYSRQVAIWERKLAAIPVASVSNSWRPILRWSALPGMSRHHWGTELDWYEPRQLALAEQQLQLEPWEYEAGGPFAALQQWLAKHSTRFGFYRPYREDLGGVAPEPWHLSYAPLAYRLQAWLTPQLLRKQWQAHPFKDWEEVHWQLPALLSRYHQNVARPPATALQPSIPPDGPGYSG